ncbi:MAG: hypothetical protein K8953_13160 [Proteobacteria bacterium]|nr:hypothetical protein [Pseudomonadota bacterium]
MATLRLPVKQGNTLELVQSLDGALARFNGSLLGIVAHASVKNNAGDLLCQGAGVNLFDTDKSATFTCSPEQTALWTPGEHLFMDVRLATADGMRAFSFGTVIIIVERAITTAADSTPIQPGEPSGYSRGYNTGFTS